METNQPRATRRFSNRVILGGIGAVIALVVVVAVVAAVVLSVLGSASASKSTAKPQFITTIYSTEPAPQANNAGAADAVTPIATLAPVTPEPTAAPSATPKGDWQNGERITFLVLGIDQRPVENADYALTDSIIMVTLNPISKTAGMMSIPRDLWVDLSNHGQDRINTAMSLGGPQYAVNEVSRLMSVPIQHYVRVNFSAVQKIVDLIGGIDVYVDQDINDQLYPDMNYHFDPFVISQGMHHMDGATALKYARTRHNTSDFYRMRRQQQIIMAIRDRALSINAVPNLAANAPQIMATLIGAVQSDISVSEMAQLALFVKDLPAESIYRAVLDETTAQDYRTNGGAQVLVLVPDKLPGLIKTFYGEQP